MKNRPLCSVCLICFLLICVSVYAGKDKVVEELRPSPAEMHIQEGEETVLTGQIYRKEIREKYQVLYLKDNSIECQEQSLKESRIMVYDETKEEVHMGQTVRAGGGVSFFEPAYNPGNFNQKLYYQRQGIHAYVWAEKIEIIDKEISPFPDGLYRFRASWKSVFFRHMGERQGAILAAMILGEKGEMDAELKELYQVNGIGHVLAISGLHLSFIGAGLYQFLRRLTGSYKIGGAAGTAFLLLYVMMIGLTVSVVRAFVMFLFRVGADMAGRRYDSPTALAVSAAAVVLWRPLSIYDGGFWLSFGAVAGIIFLLPAFSSLPFQGLWAGVSVNLILFPVLLYYFYEIPVYSMLLNLYVIPMMSALLVLGILGSFLCSLPLSLVSLPGILMLKGCMGILWVYEKSCHIALSLPGSRFVIGKPELWQVVVYYVCLCAAAILWGRKRNLISVLCFLSGIILMSYRFGDMGRLNITMLDVGQGDGIFIKGPKGGAYLIDGGSSDVKGVGKYRIEPFLKSQGTGTLDYVFISHGDGDHVNGVEEMLERQEAGIRIRNLILPAEPVWDETLERLAAKAGENGTKVFVIEPGQEVAEGKLEIRCLFPSPDYKGEKGNGASMVLSVSYEGFDMLFTGDVEGEGEEELADTLEKEYAGTKWEVLKIAHHGSQNSTSERFLEVMKPEYAMISAGKDNRYGHPHEETIQRLSEAGSRIYSTQDNGAVMIEAAGEEIRME